MTIFQKPILFFVTFSFLVLFLGFSLPFQNGKNASSMLQPPEDFGSVPCLNKTLSIIAYIVQDSLGVPPPPPDPQNIEQQILSEIDSVNKDFKPICLSFKVCQFVYIDNFQYDNLDTMPNNDSLDEAKTILDLYYKPKVINMYFVADYVGSDANECGQTYMPPFGTDTLDFVAVKKSCLPGKAISHLLGHFFGLYHTHESSSGAELVNDPNCLFVGDSICDTEADPQGNVDGSCKFTGPDFKDDNDVFYFPPVDNIMSYYGTCRCRFTRQQYIRMAQVYLASRTYLW